MSFMKHKTDMQRASAGIEHKAGSRSVWAGIWTVGLLFLTDFLLKESIEKQDPKEFPKELKNSGGKILLYRNHNEGFPFGFLREKQELVKTLPLVMVSALSGAFGWLLTRKGHVLEKTALAFSIGGGLSNLYDRMFRGYVVDYFSIQWKQLKKVVFNLGDLFIFLGAAMILVNEIIREAKERLMDLRERNS